MKKQFITVTNPDMVEELLDNGHSGLRQMISGQIVYTFEVTDKLFKYLKHSNNKFSKRDYFYDTKLRF